MDEFERVASSLREQLESYFEPSELPFTAFSNAGLEGIHQIFIEGIAPENATFADHIQGQVAPEFSKFLIQAMCLGAAHLYAGCKAFKEGDSSASHCLIAAAEEIGFIRGMAFGVIHEDDISRAAKSIHGKLGGDKRAEKNAALKAWAISQNKEMVRGSATDRARRLMLEVPKELTNSSEDPERVMREAIGKEMKKNG